MFTGLIQAQGHLRSTATHQLAVTYLADPILEDVAIGDSVAVDGVCLTVERILSQGFVVTTSPETLQRTTLRQRVDTNSPVNLEPALRVGDKLGGHFVTGHIDGVGCVQEVVQSATAWEMSLTVPPLIARYIVPKGSIAVNGVSLTVAECTPDGSWFKVAIIPHSFTSTNLQSLRPNSLVNLETDLLGKYVAKLLPQSQPELVPQPQGPAASVITPAFLAEHGFG